MHQLRILCLRRAIPATRPSSVLLFSEQRTPPANAQRRTYVSSFPKNAQSAICMSNRLSGRTCMITGGSSGIGYAIAERFLREGASRVILVGRSFDRLAAAAAALLETPTLTAGEDSSTDDVATRAPEEDRQLRPRHTSPAEPLSPGSLIESSERLHLLVGDVSDAGSWGRELEKAMVSRFLPVHGYSIISHPTATRRHPRQRSRNLQLQHPPPHRTVRHLASPPHKPRRRPAHLTRAGPCLHPQQSEDPVRSRAFSRRPTSLEMHHQRVVSVGAEGRDWCRSVRGFQGWGPWAYAIVDG